MEKIIVLLVSGLFSLTSCRNDDFEENLLNQDCEFEENLLNQDCEMDTWTESKEVAKNQLIGEWSWVQTIVPSRALQITVIETPETTDKKYTYKFTNAALEIFEDQEFSNRYNYEVLYSGEVTGQQDNKLIINYFDVNTNSFSGRSILFVSVAGNCLVLNNSYNDAGGDKKFVKKR